MCACSLRAVPVHVCKGVAAPPGTLPIPCAEVSMHPSLQLLHTRGGGGLSNASASHGIPRHSYLIHYAMLRCLCCGPAQHR